MRTAEGSGGLRLGDYPNRVGELVSFANVRGEFQVRYHVHRIRRRTQECNTGRMPTCGQMIGQVPRHRVEISGQYDSIIPLGPDQDVRVLRSEWQVDWITDADRINGVRGVSVVRLNRKPQIGTEVFVEKEGERHDPHP